MGRLLGSETDAAVERDGEPSVLCLDDEGTREVMAALSSETAYDVFRLLNEEPAAPATVADRLDLSLQNAHYHVENLEEAGLIEVGDTCYSEKGREMNVYVAARDPTLVFLGTRDDRPSLKRAVRALASFVGPPAVLFAAGETLAGLIGGD
jgi:DNA-binding transcriptional ArsR family regulator